MQDIQPLVHADERLDEVNFRIRLIQKKQGLQYGTDALLLAAVIRGNGKETGAELGGGTGIVSLLCLTREKLSHIDCYEVQSAYADLIRRNASLNGQGERLRAVEADVRSVALCGTERGHLDVVFSNPPYLAHAGACNATAEKQIARHEVCGGIADFTAAAARLLRYGGRFYCVFRPERLDDLLCAMREERLAPKRLMLVCADPTTAPSLVLAEAIAGGGAGMHVLRPFYIYRAAGDRTHFSEDMQYVYHTGTLPPDLQN